ncbi:MAG TPA: hypothetical protein VEO74_01825, partial [Thermoanaerobaculia bacterium]|nr:hypothetical protein [Thermoanaerobaculia bacterium]
GSTPPDERPRIGKGYGAGRLGIAGPYSRAIDRGAIGGLIDGRSREGRFLRQYEKQLLEHVGNNPSVTQRCLIQRAARLALHLELMDERSLAGDHVFTTHDHLHYVSWSNSLARHLGRLGLEPAAAKAPSLADYLASKGEAA